MIEEEKIIQERIEMLKILEKVAIQKGLSLDDIAQRSGLIKSNISRIFAGKFSPTLDIYLKIKYAIEQ